MGELLLVLVYMVLLTVLVITVILLFIFFVKLCNIFILVVETLVIVYGL